MRAVSVLAAPGPLQSSLLSALGADAADDDQDGASKASLPMVLHNWSISRHLTLDTGLMLGNRENWAQLFSNGGCWVW